MRSGSFSNFFSRYYLAAALVCTVLLVGGCASVPRPAWPPKPGEPIAHVTVYADHFHSVLALPREPKGYEEWAFGERIWFYDEKGKHRMEKLREACYTCLDGMRALVWPNIGVIEISRADDTYLARNKDHLGSLRAWQIPVSPAGLAAMRKYLDGTIGSHKEIYTDGWQVYYPSAARYHLFHTCHHFAAQALLEAGVPIHPGWCVIPSGFWRQLDKVSKKNSE